LPPQVGATFERRGGALVQPTRFADAVVIAGVTGYPPSVLAVSHSVGELQMGCNLYSGKPWSEMDGTDLERLSRMGVPIEEIADFLLREVEEVRQKMAALNVDHPDGALAVSGASVMNSSEGSR
jgi:hypothetical protein